MIDFFRAALQLPLATMAGFAEAFLVSLRQMQHAMDAGFAGRGVNLSEESNYGHRPQEGYAPVEVRDPGHNDYSDEPPFRAIDNASSLTNAPPEALHMNYRNYDSEHEFFADRNYVKVYEYVVVYIGEGETHRILESGYEATSDDTSQKCLENHHRDHVIHVIRNAINRDQNNLPAGWRATLPSFLHLVNNTVQIHNQQVFDDLNDNVEATVRPLARYFLRARNDDRRQSKALEGIAAVVGRIEEHGLKTREY